MPFIEPALLWGALAVVIPVVIHFWHQKQGKPLPWAAMQWLTEKQQQQSRGLRLDNVWLLIIRCLLLMLLAMLLAQPLLNWFSKPPTIQKVHLVQPSLVVPDNFRFELTDALKKKEKVVWATEPPTPVNDQLSPPQQSATVDLLQLQAAINKLDFSHTELHLYLVNDRTLTTVPAITVPARFRLHTLPDSSSQPRPYIAVKNPRKLFVNRSGKLTSSLTLDPALRFQSAPVHAGPVAVLLSYRNERERQTVKAALTALVDVYGLDLAIDEKPIPDRRYDWVLTDQPPVKPTPQTLFIVSGLAPPTTSGNVVFTHETLTPQTSERVETGQLPEWLGSQLIRHFGIDTNRQPLSQQALKTIFVTLNKPATPQQAGMQNTLLLLFVVLLLIERWLALTKNA